MTQKTIAFFIIITAAATFYWMIRTTPKVTPLPAAQLLPPMAQPTSTEASAPEAGYGQKTSASLSSINMVTKPVRAASANVKTPDFMKPLVFGSDISAEAKTSLESALEKTQKDLKADTKDFDAWIALGSLYHAAGDYAGEKETWEYVGAWWPGNIISFNNLGVLYANHLKDYPKAEANFLTAIKNKPNDVNPYRNLFDLYSSTSYKPTNTAALDILTKAIKANHDLVELRVLLGRYYKETGNTAAAKTAYGEAADLAHKQGNDGLAKAIEDEAGTVQ